jgi:hypothetical protein
VWNTRLPGDELQHVFVRRHDHDIESLRRGLCRERPDDVVGFITGQFQDRDPVGVEGAADVLNLGGQVRSHRNAVGLVPGIGVVAHGPFRAVPGDGEVIGSVLAQHLAQHRHEAVDGVGGLAGRCREALDGVVGAMDIGHRVHQVELARVGHERAIL